MDRIIKFVLGLFAKKKDPGELEKLLKEATIKTTINRILSSYDPSEYIHNTNPKGKMNIVPKSDLEEGKVYIPRNGFFIKKLVIIIMNGEQHVVDVVNKTTRVGDSGYKLYVEFDEFRKFCKIAK